jgi:polysaccharide export outer membrane protein
MNTRTLCSAVLVLMMLGTPLSAARAGEPDKPAGNSPAAVEKSPAAVEKSSAAANQGEYRIGPEDILQISVWKNEAITKTVPVRPDGKISLPLVNDVQAAGLTSLELRDVLAKGLAEYIPNPEVSVIVAEVRSFKVSVIGEVARPARYELKSWTTVLDALALAGGFTPFAARSRVVVLRPDGNGMKRIPFNYSKVVSNEGFLEMLRGGAGGDQENFYLRNGDIIFVP